jgi:hypothetical protein
MLPLPCRCARLYTVLLTAAVSCISVGFAVVAIAVRHVSKVDVDYCTLVMNRTCASEEYFLVANRYCDGVCLTASLARACPSHLKGKMAETET